MTSELKFLLVDDKPEERSVLRRLLAASELGIANIEESGTGAEAHSLSQELAPDIILVSFEEPIARGIKTIETLAGNGYGLVVAISSLGDRESLRRAMRAGAREYLVKPVKPKEMARVIQDVLEEERRRELLSESGKLRGDVFTVMGPKGGIGKTSLAANLAVALAIETKQRVAIVDLAAQLGDVAMMLDVVPERTIADLTGITRSLEPEMLDSFLTVHASGVKVLAAAPEVDHHSPPSASLVHQIVEGLAKTCDYVVIDGDCLLTPVLWAALELTTVVLMVTSADTSSIKNAKQFLEALRSQGYGEDKVKLVMNFPYQHDGVSTGELSKILNYPLFWKLPHDSAVPQCINLGQPFVQVRPKAKISQNVLQLARTISGVDTQRGSFLGQVLKR
ncbi:MAG: response regulator [Dehalococcoidia bacterium]|nr:response regulator [Dehalococcoidia bacterium]